MKLRIFSLGIGDSSDKYLIEKISNETFGSTDYINIGERMENKVINMLKLCFLKNINIQNNLKIDVNQDYCNYPVNINLISHDLILYSHFDSILDESVFSGVITLKDDKIKIEYDFLNNKNMKIIPKEKNGILSVISINNFIKYLESIDEKKKIIKLSMSYNIVSKYTSFLAISNINLSFRKIMITPKGKTVTIINGNPVLIKNISVSKTGKHGHAKKLYIGTDIDGKLVEHVVSSKEELQTINYDKDDSIYSSENLEKIILLQESNGSYKMNTELLELFKMNKDFKNEKIMEIFDSVKEDEVDDLIMTLVIVYILENYYFQFYQSNQMIIEKSYSWMKENYSKIISKNEEIFHLFSNI
jgi:translation elongation factor P/translation initiation factor 5A